MVSFRGAATAVAAVIQNIKAVEVIPYAVAAAMTFSAATLAQIDKAAAGDCNKCELADLSLNYWGEKKLKGYSTVEISPGKVLHCNPYGATNPNTGEPMRNCWITFEKAAPNPRDKATDRRLAPCNPCGTAKRHER